MRGRSHEKGLLIRPIPRVEEGGCGGVVMVVEEVVVVVVVVVVVGRAGVFVLGEGLGEGRTRWGRLRERRAKRGA